MLNFVLFSIVDGKRWGVRNLNESWSRCFESSGKFHHMPGANVSPSLSLSLSVLTAVFCGWASVLDSHGACGWNFMCTRGDHFSVKIIKSRCVVLLPSGMTLIYIFLNVIIFDLEKPL